MERPAVQGAEVNKAQIVSPLLIMAVCLAAVAWLVVTAAQGVVFCSTILFGFKR